MARKPRQALEPAVRAAIVAELRDPRDPPRARAEIAREHGCSPRTIARIAAEAGIDTRDAFDTSSIARATQAATDRRRARRSQLADELLNVEVPRLIARLANADHWQRTVVVPGPDGRAERVVEDDATVARGMKDLHAALGQAIGQTLAIDKADTQADDNAGGEVLDRLFTGLDAAYRELQRRGEQAEPADDGTTADDPHED